MGKTIKWEEKFYFNVFAFTKALKQNFSITIFHQGLRTHQLVGQTNQHWYMAKLNTAPPQGKKKKKRKDFSHSNDKCSMLILGCFVFLKIKPTFQGLTLHGYCTHNNKDVLKVSKLIFTSPHGKKRKELQIAHRKYLYFPINSGKNFDQVYHKFRLMFMHTKPRCLFWEIMYLEYTVHIHYT